MVVSSIFITFATLFEKLYAIMNNSFKTTLLMCVCCALFSCSGKQGEADYSVIPLPKSVSLKDTACFVLSPSTVIASGIDSASQANARFLSDELYDFCGIRAEVIDGGNDTSNVIIIRSYAVDGNAPDSAGGEAYAIDINPDSIVVTGSPAGQFYAIQTLCKSVPAGRFGSVSMPSAHIADYPRFGYRGMHLDVARHFFPVSFVKKYIDIMALHDMNALHLHLTDDQGWRVEIKKYPKLTEIGSKRSETVIGHNSGKYDGKPYGGFYTQDDIRDIVAYAAARHIEIIPEIDMPGHMQAALASYPELGCTGGPYTVLTEWGISKDVLCPGNPASLNFVTEVLNEVMDLFPSKYIHIGGDECPRDRWKECPKCQALIAAEHLDTVKSAASREDALQGWFMKYAERVIEARGRKVIGWDEILEGGQADNATVMSWRGSEGGITAAKKGCDVVMSPNTACYFDYYQTPNPAREPLAIGGCITVKNVYDWDPMPEGLKEGEREHILGAQANIWTEYMPTGDHVIHMMIPRADALCEDQWCDPSQKNYDEFLKRLDRMRALYDHLGYTYAPYVFNGEDR